MSNEVHSARPIHRLLLLCLCLAFCGCLSPRYTVPAAPGADYIHLHARGSWGSDTDIWIFPNDTFTSTAYQSKSRRIEERRHGQTAGLFRSVIGLAQQQHAWSLTSQSMKADLEAAKDPHTAYGVMDADDEFLDIRSGGRRLTADFYAAESYYQTFPTALTLRKFSRITSKIRHATVQPQPRLP